MHLAWVPPAGGGSPAARYVVESSATPLGTTLPIATVDAAQHTFDLPLSQGTYFFRVRAQNDAGMSPPSNEAIATVGVAGMPGPPTALRAAIAGSQVSLSWQRPAASPDRRGTASSWVAASVARISASSTPGRRRPRSRRRYPTASTWFG